MIIVFFAESARYVGDTLDGHRSSLLKALVAWGTRWMVVGLLC
jgi:hypothetical protein